MLYRQAGEELKRFAAVQSDPNSLAMTLALALPMAWYLGMTYKNPILRWVCRVFIADGPGRDRPDGVARRHARGDRRAHDRAADHDQAVAGEAHRGRRRC